MSIGLLVVGVAIIYAVAYRFYGRFLSSKIKFDDSRATPARELNDGVDYVPAKASFLLGQHFSAIAAAGPIVGPIMACLWFGWVPAVLWIVVGAIFVGGAHDFFSLVASLRHRGCSIGEIVKQYMPPSARIFFLVFMWLTLLYIIIAFTDVTAHTFKTVIKGEAFGPGVAASSVLYLLAAVLMGILLRRKILNVGAATAIFLPVVLFIVWVGPRLPEPVLSALAGLSVKQWDVILLGYCLVASLIPMWLLLQPRGYLGGWLLYLVIAVGLIGALFGGYKMEYPAFMLNGAASSVNGKALFPLLFITIACGACSGFHGVVSSGTTSKQVCKESDSMVIGYGAMLLEGLVAVLAISTVIMLPVGSAVLKTDPNLIYANGIAQYLGLIKIGYGIALPFALLAFSTFVYDTLDVSTRLARYILQELLGWRSRVGGFAAAMISLVIPFLFLIATKEKGYLVAWPIFGTSNQLLASLILLVVSVWLIKNGRRPFYTILPMIFMLGMTLWSLVNMSTPFVGALLSGKVAALSVDGRIAGICSSVLLVLSCIFVVDVFRLLVGQNIKSCR